MLTSLTMRWNLTYNHKRTDSPAPDMPSERTAASDTPPTSIWPARRKTSGQHRRPSSGVLPDSYNSGTGTGNSSTSGRSQCLQQARISAPASRLVTEQSTGQSGHKHPKTSALQRSYRRRTTQLPSSSGRAFPRPSSSCKSPCGRALENVSGGSPAW